MFASGATQTESYLNPFFEATQEMKDKTTPEDIARSAPVIGPAVSRFLGSPADQQQITAMNQFYNAAQAAQTPIATFEYLKKYQPEAAQAYMQAHQDELYQGAVANKLYAKMSELSTKEKEIQAATDIPAVEKQDMLKNLRAARQMVISTGMQMLRPNPQVPQASAYPGQGQGAPH